MGFFKGLFMYTFMLGLDLYTKWQLVYFKQIKKMLGFDGASAKRIKYGAELLALCNCRMGLGFSLDSFGFLKLRGNIISNVSHSREYLEHIDVSGAVVAKTPCFMRQYKTDRDAHEFHEGVETTNVIYNVILDEVNCDNEVVTTNYKLLTHCFDRSKVFEYSQIKHIANPFLILKYNDITIELESYGVYSYLVEGLVIDKLFLQYFLKKHHNGLELIPDEDGAIVLLYIAKENMMPMTVNLNESYLEFDVEHDHNKTCNIAIKPTS